MKILQRLFKEPLEREFTRYAFKHKYRILKNKLVDYYKTVEQDEVNLSGAYYVSPEQRAQAVILETIKTDVNKFNLMYEKAYIEFNS